MVPEFSNEKTRITLLDVAPELLHERTLCDSIGGIIDGHLRLRASDQVYIKPNLTLPWYVPGACTSKIVLDVLCQILKDKGCKVRICEGDGGVASYSAYEAFAGNGLLNFGRRYNVKFISLSLLSRKSITRTVGGKEVTFDLPAPLVDREFDIFINIPVLKVHVYTSVSFALKNLFGCIPDPLRIHYHRIIDGALIALWQTIRPDLSIIDGLIAMDGNGPLNGIPVPMGIIAAGSKDATIDRIGAKLLRVPFNSVRHLMMAEKEGLIQAWDKMQVSQPLQPFCKRAFKAEKRLSNWGMIAMSQVPVLQKIVYYSSISKTIYRLLRRLRKNNVQNDLRKCGDPNWGEGCGRSDFCSFLGRAEEESHT
jgi:uncharacterized protein (DUF362 family)